MHIAASLPKDINWSKLTFVVADPKPPFHEMVQTSLLGAGAKAVKHATTVENAIEILNRYGQEISCVICDWEMSPVGGIELLRMIRSRVLRKTSPRTPVVILTGRADSAAVKAAMAMDVNGLAIAPLSVEKLVKTVSQALSREWTLHEPSHYSAVPGVETAAPESREPNHAPDARVLHRPAAGATSGGPPKSSPTPLEQRAPTLKNIHMCTLSEVRPGQVLARDLKDRQGHLLLRAGSVIGQTLISRLTDVAEGHADSYHLWIGEPEGHHP